MENSQIANIKRQLEEQGYNIFYVEYIIVGERYNFTYKEFSKIIEIHVLNLEYFQKIKSIQFEEASEYKFIFTYGGERNKRKPSKTVLCKMKPEEREKLLNIYN